MVSAPDQPASLIYPELIVGIAGPIGVDLDLIARSLESAFSKVDYTTSLIRLTSEMDRFPITDPDLLEDVNKWQGADTYNTYMRKMSAANALRKQYKDPAVLARIAIDAIRLHRRNDTGNEKNVRTKHAFLVRQLKRPEEVILLRKVYGRQFVLVSAYAPGHSYIVYGPLALAASSVVYEGLPTYPDAGRPLQQQFGPASSCRITMRARLILPS
jgi:cytidine deaminase